VAALLVLVGVVARVWMLRHAPLNADEANAGLMARQILHGHFYTFFWGGQYGGIEPYAIAPFVLVFGNNPIALNAVPAVLAGVTCLLVWRVGLLVFRNRAVAALAGAVAWVWPENNLWQSTRESGFRQATFVCGLLVLLLAARVAYRSRLGAQRDWLLLGLAAGAGWWSSPEIVYYLAPAGVLLLLRHGRALRDRDPALWGRVARAAVGGVIGALPWLYTNIHDGFLSLTEPTSHTSYGTRLHVFAAKVAPMLLGFRAEGAGQWILRPPVARGLDAVAVEVLIVAAISAFWWQPRARFLVAGIVVFPFLYAAFPPNGFWNDGRYGAPLAPMIVLVLIGGGALLLSRLARLAPNAAGGLGIAAGLAVLATVAAMFNLSQGHALGSWSALTSFGHDPDRGTRQVISDLDALHVDHAYATYWISYDVMFLSGNRITMSEIDDIRWRDAYDAVNASPGPAWVYVNPQAEKAAADQFGVKDLGFPESQIIGYLRAHAIAYQYHRVGLVDVIQPARKVTPRDIGARPVFVWNPAQ
jgi:4-amino-4-deoxy-L-arabinose transferase-like glycosyltransferase